jgi:hypothetical protein
MGWFDLAAAISRRARRIWTCARAAAGVRRGAVAEDEHALQQVESHFGGAEEVLARHGQPAVAGRGELVGRA